MDRLDEFQACVVPHMAIAYGMAFQITGDASESDDIVQDALLRACGSFDAFSGGNVRHWFLKIVRNIAVYRVGQLQRSRMIVSLDDPHLKSECVGLVCQDENAEQRLMSVAEAARIKKAIDALSPFYREAMLLREVEELSYRDISERLGVPVGTVMSRLARGREQLRAALYATDLER